MKSKVLIVDDEVDMLSTCEAALRVPGIDVITESDPEKALELLRDGDFDLLITDIRMAKISGIDLFRAVKRFKRDIPAIFITAFPQVESAVAALREGAEDYLIKPFHPDELRKKVARVIEERRLKGENVLLTQFFSGGRPVRKIVGESTSLSKVLEFSGKIAPANVDVLIMGESGTGKELLAKRIHAASGRPGRFVAVDCGAIPETLLENELFGHVKGAYTGADSAASGLIEFADKGTFFMDEVGELPIKLQAKLLRALQEKQIRRVGGSRDIDVDVRIIAATNSDLPREVSCGRFREDLFFRLNVATMTLPPLRERQGDVPRLVEYFLPRLSEEFGKDLVRISEDAMEVLEFYRWPGNVRELENVLKRSIIHMEGSVLGANDFPEFLLESGDAQGMDFFALRKKNTDEFEKRYLIELLRKADGKVREAAKSGGVPLSNFYHYIKKHGIEPKAYLPRPS